MPLKTVKTPELKGLYANANRFTIPKGSVPRISNMYMIRRGAFHTVPGTQWLSSNDGLPPHRIDQPPIVDLRWYSPSRNSGAAKYMSSFTQLGPNPDYAVSISQTTATTLTMRNVSQQQAQQISSLAATPTGLVNSAQFGDLLFVALGAGTIPSVFPLYTFVTFAVGPTDTAANVQDTSAFPKTGYFQIDNEILHYTGITPTQFTGVTHGQLGTIAALHAVGAAVSNPINGQVAPNLQLAVTISPTATTGLYFNILNHGAQPPTAAFMVIQQEVISYTGFTMQSATVGLLSGVVRGTNGTTAIAHSAGTPIYPIASFPPPPPTQWGFVVNHFDPSLIYNPWPGVANSSAAASAIPVNIGTIIFETDPQGTSWLFRAQNSGVTGFGANYAGPNFFPSQIGNPGDTIRDHNAANNSGTLLWLNVGQAALSPPGAAYVFQHLDCLFLWGVGQSYGADGITGPDALWQSDKDDPQSFNPGKTTFVGKGDGTTAQGGCVYSLSEAGIAATPQLVLFKDASTYSFLNSFDANPALVPVSGGLGCIAPESVQFIGGFGVMRLSYMGFTLFDGQLEHVSEYTDAIRGYLFGGLPDVAPLDLINIQKSVSFQCINPNMYWCFCPIQGGFGALPGVRAGSGVATRGFGYDWDLKQWAVIDLPFPVSAAVFNPQASFVATNYQSIVGGVDDGVVRSMFSGATDWDGLPIQAHITFPEMGFPGSPVYLRRVNLRATDDGLPVGTSKIMNTSFTGTRRSGLVFTRPLNTPISILSTLDVGEKVLSGAISLIIQGQVLLEGTEAQIDEMPTARVGK